VTGDMTVSGTTTTLDTELQSVDKLEVGANSSDYGVQINQTGTGNILQLQDNGTDVLVVADGGAVSGTAVLDEDNMASDSATKIATQASIKAYGLAVLADANLTASNGLAARVTATTLNSGVVASSLTSVGTLTAVTVTGLITANGGIETDTNSKVKQKGAFMQSSTHQALTLGY